MLGRTHVAVGVASALVILHPTTVTGILGAVAGGTLGGAICDLDTRKAQVGDGKISSLELSVLLVFGTAVIDYITKAGVYSYILSHMNTTALLLFLGGCVVGFFSPHRSVMHSIIALVFFSVLIRQICLPIAAAFTIGFISHLVLDLLNKKGMLLLFPLPFRICFDLCASDGAVNKHLGRIATTLSTAMTVLLVGMTITGNSFSDLAALIH